MSAGAPHLSTTSPACVAATHDTPARLMGASGDTACARLGEIRFLETLITKAGLDVGAVLEAVGAPRDLFRRGDDARLALPAYFRVLERLSDALGDETVTASARPLRPGTARLVLGGVSRGMTLAAAMGHIADAYNVVHAGDYNRLLTRADRLIYTIDDRDFPFAVATLGPTRHAFMESVLVFLHAIVCELAATPITDAVLEVETRRPAAAPGGAFLSPWKAPIRYGATTYAIHYAASVAHIPARAAGDTAFAAAPVYRVIAERVAAAAEERAARASWRDAVSAVLSAGRYDQRCVARALGVSPASLRRRLTEEGVTFRALKARARDEHAKLLLAQGHSIHDVAERLAYSEARSFTRAFLAHNRLTPSAYRARLSGRP